MLAALAIFAVLFSTLTLEQFLIKNALQQEAHYYWRKYEDNKQVPPPDTWNLKSYLVDADSGQDQLPQPLQNTPAGFTRLKDMPGFTLMYKTEQDGKQLLLLFDGENVRELALFLGIIPLTLFLVLSYVLGWLLYRKAQQVLSPIIWLANKFDRFDPLAAKMPTIELTDMPQDADWEATVLAQSLSDYVERIKRFIARERSFTRDVSHELRTPLTVIGMAADMIKAENHLTEHDAKSLERIVAAAKDMRELVEVFLILARESDNRIEEEPVWVTELIEREIENSKMLLEDKPISVEIERNHALVINTSEKILQVMLGNLIRNAFSYTDAGNVTIIVNENNVIVSDTGTGMDEQQVGQVFQPFYRAGERQRGGHGVGLTIVKRISDRFNWRVDIQSEVGVGTKVTVYFEE